MGCNSSKVAALDLACVHPEKGVNTAAADPVSKEKKGLRTTDASNSSLGSGGVQKMQARLAAEAARFAERSSSGVSIESRKHDLNPLPLGLT